MARAGGLLPTASVDEAAVIRRVGVGSWDAEPELLRLERLGASNSERMTEDEYNYLVARTRQFSKQVMVVNFKRLLQGDTKQDMLLRDEDSISIPRARGYVSVTGAVNNQGNVNLIEGGKYEDYIMRAGGYSASADRSGVRIINSKTSSYIDPTSDDDYKIGAGDVIVIPNERSNFWKNFETVSAVTAQVITIVAGILLLTRK
jgi:hypothetical protein